MPLTITSPAFDHEGPIPGRYTCDGEDVSPALHWSGAPDGTRSFALIVQDPDAPDPAAPERIYVHWVLYDIPLAASGLDEDVSDDALPSGTRIGTNDWGKREWGGPCPPIGRHRYFFKLYALDTMLGELGAATRDDVERAMEGHILEATELMGTYEHPWKEQREG